MLRAFRPLQGVVFNSTRTTSVGLAQAVNQFRLYSSAAAPTDEEIIERLTVVLKGYDKIDPEK
eukprot:Pgem_evm1s18499